jgi:molybdopterin converting factor small subunit/GNAT superfamily N-acetyltransferase
MTIQLLFFAQARERAGSGQATLELPHGSRVRDALARIRERYPALAELMPHLAVAMNQRLVGPEEAIVEGAELALLPPVSGGMSAPRIVVPTTKRSATKRPAAPPVGKLRVLPATVERWADLEKLFGPRGACAGCWCMWCRVRGAEFKAGKGDGNKRKLRRLVKQGPPPGLIGYLGEQPVAWCAIGPRESFQRLAGSRTLAPVDAQPVWSVPCFFVARGARGAGLTVQMLDQAAKFAQSSGASVLEGYPIEPGGKTADAFAWWGLVGAFEQAGFEEVLRRSPTHPIMRRRLGRRPAARSAKRAGSRG